MSCGLRQGELTTLNGSEHVVYPHPILMGKMQLTVIFWVPYLKTNSTIPYLYI